MCGRRRRCLHYLYPLVPHRHQHLTLLKIKSSTIGKLHSILKVNTQLITPSCKMPTFILQKRWGISDLCTGWNGKGYVQLKQCNSSVVHGYMGSCRLATIFKDLGNFTQNPSVQNQLRQKPVDLHRDFERGWNRVKKNWEQFQHHIGMTFVAGYWC